MYWHVNFLCFSINKIPLWYIFILSVVNDRHESIYTTNVLCQILHIPLSHFICFCFRCITSASNQYTNQQIVYSKLISIRLFRYFTFYFHFYSFFTRVYTPKFQILSFFWIKGFLVSFSDSSSLLGKVLVWFDIKFLISYI